jgi:hypothetical protein
MNACAVSLRGAGFAHPRLAVPLDGLTGLSGRPFERIFTQRDRGRYFSFVTSLAEPSLPDKALWASFSRVSVLTYPALGRAEHEGLARGPLELSALLRRADA